MCLSWLDEFTIKKNVISFEEHICEIQKTELETLEYLETQLQKKLFGVSLIFFKLDFL